MSPMANPDCLACAARAAMDAREGMSLGAVGARFPELERGACDLD